MTALSATAPAPPAATPAPAGQRGASAAGRGAEGPPDAFAQALQRRQAADAAPSAPSDGARPGSATPPPEAPLDAGPDTPMPVAAEPTPPVAVDVQTPAPGWPPAGLAGLLGFADEADPMDATAGAQQMPIPPPGAAAAGASVAPAPAPAATPALAEMPPVDDAAIAAAALLPEPAATGEDGAPAPVAFVLPAPVALREPPPLLAAPLPTPEVGADDFEARFGAQIEWMASQKISEARIRVTPNDLGPVEVRLHLDGDRIRAEFVSANAETRQALEHGLPRLRDLLGEHGFQLAHAGVGGGEGRGPSTPGARDTGGGTGSGAAEPAAAMPQRRSLGLLDAYA